MLLEYTHKLNTDHMLLTRLGMVINKKVCEALLFIAMPFLYGDIACCKLMNFKGDIKMALNFPKKGKDKPSIEILAPVNGKIIPIIEVPDPVFSEKMMGEGIAFIPVDGKFCSPVNGKVIHVFPTKHAIGIVADDGTEILIHIGLETVALKGEGFTTEVEVGEKVVVGQVLVDVDLDYIRNHASSIVTPMVITNSVDGDKEYIMTQETEGSVGKTIVITVSAT